MKRNMYKIAETVSVNNRYDMNMYEMASLMKMCETKFEIIDAIYIAFTYGYEMGKRALKAEMKKADK